MQQGLSGRTIPVHARIAGVLQDEIREKKFARGDKLPSESQLCERFGVNRYTVRLALESLIQSGLVQAQHGKGHFVNVQPLMIEYPLSPVMRFSDAIRANGCVPSSRIISVRLEPASETAAKGLGVTSGTLTYRLDILRLADGVPIAWNETWLPAERVPDLQMHLEPFESLYAVLKTVYAIELQRDYTTFESTYPTTQMLTQFNVTPNTTILRIESVTRGQDGQRIEYTAAHYRGDLCKISIYF